MEKSLKKKIAVYANGWNNQITLEALAGMKAYAKEEDFDINVFYSHASYNEYDYLNQGELRIYDLANISDFDGAIMFSGMLNSPGAVKRITERAKEAGVPLISVGVKVDGIPFVGINNEVGMRQLATRLVEDCGVKRVVYVGGTPDHVDSNERQRVLEEVLAEHGLSLAPEDICFGEWGNHRARSILRDVLLPRGLPDAVVCANDVMALALMSTCAENGIKIPEQMKVTGFDCITEGQINYPSLTTVTQNYEEVGYTAVKMLYDLIYGRETEMECLVPSKLVAAESCGGDTDKDYEKIRQQYCQAIYGKYLVANQLEQSERMLRTRISEAEDYEELRKNLKTHYTNNNFLFEGNDCAMMLDSEYVRDVMKEESELVLDSFDERFEVVVCRHDGTVIDCTGMSIDRHRLIPAYEKVPGVQRVFFFMPLHTLQYNYGYMQFDLDAMIIQEGRMYTYVEKAQQALTLLRINLRLEAMNQNLIRLYDKDPMTDLYNRFAYEDKAIPLIEESKKSKSTAMVLFVDINYMKRINDQYGRIHGDNAIRTVATAIKKNIEENWIAVRYGGDEFLVIAPDCGEEKAELTRQRILNYLEERNQDSNQPYHISASSGYVITDPDSDMTMEDYIKEADKLMYEMKAIVHANDPR